MKRSSLFLSLLLTLFVLPVSAATFTYHLVNVAPGEHHSWKFIGQQAVHVETDGYVATAWWDPAMPQSIPAGGEFTLNIHVRAQSAVNSRLNAGIGIRNGDFAATPSDPSFSVTSENGHTEQGSMSVRLKAPSNESSFHGRNIYIHVGSWYGLGVWYTYQAWEN